jgi:hypothetical protein
MPQISKIMLIGSRRKASAVDNSERFILLANDERMHHYQRRRTSITGLRLQILGNIETGRLIGVAVSRLVEQSRMAAIPPRGALASYGVEGVWRARHGFRTMTKKARHMFGTSPPQGGIRITAASSISKV